MSKKIFERWTVSVDKSDGVKFEKLEKDFVWKSYNPKKFAPDGVTEIHFKEVLPDEELTEMQVTELNSLSENNGIRYYAK
jgi:hypothetical protein